MFNYYRTIIEPLWSAVLYVNSNTRPTLGLRVYFRCRNSKLSNYEQLRYGPTFSSSIGSRALNSTVTIKNLKYPARWLSFYAIIHATTAESVKDSTKEENIDIVTLLYEADDLFDQYKYSEIVELLQPLKDSKNVDVLWRLCKALYYMSKEVNGNKMKELIKEAYNIIHRALELDDNNYAVHKWYSIMLDAHAQTQGFRARLNEIVNVKHHMTRAIELNPTDATTLYMLGSWCFGVSDLPWYQRKIVVTLFGSFPTSSFEEALFYFKKAEETKPLFYSLNLLMLGKTYMKLQDFEEARRYLTLASIYPARSDEDHQANKEAADLLKQLPS